MLKKIFFIFMILFISTNVFSFVLEEKTLNSINAGDLIINKNESVCKEYDFSFNKSDNKATGYLQLFIKNYIPINNNVTLIINLNTENIKTISDTNIKEKNFIELTNLKNKNILEICVENNFLPRMVLDKDSVVGLYYVGKIEENGFYQTFPTYAYTNTLIPISLHVENSGYGEIYVELINATEKFIYNSNLENVSGETSFKGTLNPQEKLTLNYFIKTDLNTSFATPYAQLKYVDVFGVERERFLKTEIINLLEQKSNIQVLVDVFRKIEVNNEYTGHLIIRNNSESIVTDVFINPMFNGNIILDKQSISVLNQKDVIEIPFKIKTFKTGDYSLSFNVFYKVDNDERNINSSNINITSENKINKETTATIILIVITIILFIWIVKI